MGRVTQPLREIEFDLNTRPESGSYQRQPFFASSWVTDLKTALELFD